MKKVYEWREISDDGLLKKAEMHGPYYDTFGPNKGWHKYESKEEAEIGLSEFFDKLKGQNWTPTVEYILVEYYTNAEDN